MAVAGFDCFVLFGETGEQSLVNLKVWTLLGVCVPQRACGGRQSSPSTVASGCRTQVAGLASPGY